MLWNFIILITGVSLSLALAGVNVAGITSLLELIGVSISQSGIAAFAFESSTVWNAVFGTKTGILTAISLGGVIGLGLFVYTKDKAFLIIPLITGVWFYWISVLISITKYAMSYPVFGTILGAIMIVLTVGFFQSCVDYFAK